MIEIARDCPARMLLFHHPSSLAHDPSLLSPDHPDTPARIEAVEAALAAADDLRVERRSARAAGTEELELVHDAVHVERIAALSAAGGGAADADTFVGPASYDAALHAAGGACAMVEALVGEARPASFCLLRPAGHHAERARAMGFCLFNNVAIAAEAAIRHLGVGRVMIVDWDVHHGNGTAEIFRHRSDVLVASIHQSGLYPGTGPVSDAGSGEGLGYTINLPVAAGSDEDVWLSLVEHLIVPVGLEFRPELLLISAGFDAHRDDPLGSCRLDAAAFGQMACHVRDLAGAVGAPIGAVLEGGYDLTALGDCVVATLRALDGEGEAESRAPDPVVTPRAAAHIGHFWTL